MDKPTTFNSYQATDDIYVLPSYFPIPGLGILPVNAFVLKASQPVLVDTGLVPLSNEFMENLSNIINPADLRWLWLTHTDQDHIGSLWKVLESTPNLRIITTYIGIGKMSLFKPLPMDRVYLLNPGESIDIGDRIITAVKPPTYDAPETTGFYDPKSSAFFCADCFGALMSEPVENASEIEKEILRKNSTLWATVDAPWLHSIDRTMFYNSLNKIRELSPKLILSAHLPVAYNMTEELIDWLKSVPEAQPFIGPNQIALESMMKEMAKA